MQSFILFTLWKLLKSIGRDDNQSEFRLRPLTRRTTHSPNAESLSDSEQTCHQVILEIIILFSIYIMLLHVFVFTLLENIGKFRFSTSFYFN